MTSAEQNVITLTPSLNQNVAGYVYKTSLYNAHHKLKTGIGSSNSFIIDCMHVLIVLRLRFSLIRKDSIFLIWKVYTSICITIYVATHL